MAKGIFCGDFRDTKTKPTGIILAPPPKVDLSGIQPSPPQPFVNWGKPAPSGGTFDTKVNNCNGGSIYTPPPTKPNSSSATSSSATKVVLKQSTFEYSFDTTGVMDYAGKMDATSVQSLADLINIRGTMTNGWGPNVFAKISVLDLSHCGLTGVALTPLFQSMYYQKMNLNVLNLSHNLLCDQSSPALLEAIHNKSGKQVHSTTSIMLNNNQFGDKTAEYFSWHLSSGTLSYTKSINLAGNNITADGVNCFAQALPYEGAKNLRQLDLSNKILEQQAQLDRIFDPMLKGVQAFKGHIAVTISQISSGVNTTGTVIGGSKDAKKAVIKDVLQKAQNNGVDVKNVAVSKGLGSYIWNKIGVSVDFVVGFTKCNIVPESVRSFAADQITAKVSKKAFAVSAAKDATLCFFSTIEEVANSPEGVQFIKDIDLLGANEVIDSIE